MLTKLLHKAFIVTFFITTLLTHTILKAQPQISYGTVLTGLSSPVDIVAANDGTNRLFIVQQRGVIRIWDGTALLPTPFLDITSLLSTGGEQGLLSMAFHPDYSTNGFFFVYYTNTGGDIIVARYTVSTDPNIANPTPNPAGPLVQIPKPFANHNGGHLQFKISGGINYLYFGTGDGGDANDPFGNAQNPGSFLGKMLRIDADDASIPITPTVWAIGLRNPFRWSFDRVNGDMWIGDVGQGLQEEVDFRDGGASGANYGWRCIEGTAQNTNVTPLCNPPGAVVPVLTYPNPGSGSAVTGGFVYHGTEFPALQGYYIATDYFSGQIWLIRSPNFGGLAVTTQMGLANNIAAYGEREDGSLYAVSTGGTLYKVNATGGTLPLNLVQFSGASYRLYNELKWTTTAEENLDKFIVEYSLDGNNFLPAGEVVPSGNSNGAAYSYKHSINNPGKILYRLRIQDIGGATHFSSIITLSQTNNDGIRVYPTTITTNVVQVNAGPAIERVEVFSSDGKQVHAQNMNGVTGYFNMTLPGLQKGIYFLKFTGKDFQKTEKIILQ